jgi:hypothetical protein
MFPIVLLSIVFVPVVLGIALAGRRHRPARTDQVLGMLAIYCVLYIIVLYYLRGRWVG